MTLLRLPLAEHSEDYLFSTDASGVHRPLPVRTTLSLLSDDQAVPPPGDQNPGSSNVRLVSSPE